MLFDNNNMRVCTPIASFSAICRYCCCCCYGCYFVFKDYVPDCTIRSKYATNGIHQRVVCGYISGIKSLTFQIVIWLLNGKSDFHTFHTRFDCTTEEESGKGEGNTKEMMKIAKCTQCIINNNNRNIRNEPHLDVITFDSYYYCFPTNNEREKKSNICTLHFGRKFGVVA